jgi:hypothetical protein
MYVTFEKKEENMKIERNFIIVMENDWWILIFLLMFSVWFRTSQKYRESNSYEDYIEFCYAHILITCFFYKIKNNIYYLW